jgi:hypothetical protein
VIPNTTKGGQTARRIAYLIGKGHRGEHVDPRLVCGHALAIPVGKGMGELLEKGDSKALTAWLDEYMHSSGNYPKTRAKVETVVGEDGGQVEQTVAGPQENHYRGWSLTLPEGERLSDEQWDQVASLFMTKMRFHGKSEDVPARWLTIAHGPSGGKKLDHVHIAANRVCADGTLWDDGFENIRAQQACDEIAQELTFTRADGTTFKLARVAGQRNDKGPRGTRGIKKGELESNLARDGHGRDRKVGNALTDANGQIKRTRDGRIERVDPAQVNEANSDRRRLEQIVSSCATAAANEREFILLLRRHDAQAFPRYAKGGKDEVIGFSVGFRPPKGEKWVTYAGGKLAKDLTLPALRAKWPAWTRERQLDAWRKPQERATVTVGPEIVEQAETELGRAQEILAGVDVRDTQAWSAAAREVAGIFNTLSLETEREPGPLADAARLLRTTTLHPRYSETRPQRLVRRAGLVASRAVMYHPQARSSQGVHRSLQIMGRQISELQKHNGELQYSLELERANHQAFDELRGRLAATRVEDLSPTRSQQPQVHEAFDRGRER